MFIPEEFKASIQGRDTNLFPVVTFDIPGAEEVLRISTNQEQLTASLNTLPTDPEVVFSFNL